MHTRLERQPLQGQADMHHHAGEQQLPPRSNSTLQPCPLSSGPGVAMHCRPGLVTALCTWMCKRKGICAIVLSSHAACYQSFGICMRCLHIQSVPRTASISISGLCMRHSRQRRPRRTRNEPRRYATSDSCVLLPQTGLLAGSQWGFCASAQTLASKGAATEAMTAVPKATAPAPQPAGPPSQPRKHVRAALAPQSSAVSALQAVQVAERGTLNGTVCRLPVYSG